jgi:RNA polymerase sigma-70 factor (ECF subfamily)
MTVLSDESLIERYQHGDYGAFCELFTRHAQRLYRVCLGLCSEDAQAIELSTQAWQAVHRQRQQLSHGRLQQALCERALHFFRAHSRQQPHSAQSASQPPPSSPPKGPAAAPVLVPLLDTLRGLPESYREAVVLHRLAQLSVSQIAAVLGATQQAVLQRLAQGYAQLATVQTGQEPSVDPQTVALPGTP